MVINETYQPIGARMALHAYSKGDTVFLFDADGVTEHEVTQTGYAKLRLVGAGWHSRLRVSATRGEAEVLHRALAAARAKSEEHAHIQRERSDEASMLQAKVHGLSSTLRGYTDGPAEVRGQLRWRLRDLLKSVDALDRQHGTISASVEP